MSSKKKSDVKWCITQELLNNIFKKESMNTVSECTRDERSKTDIFEREIIRLKTKDS